MHHRGYLHLLYLKHMTTLIQHSVQKARGKSCENEDVSSNFTLGAWSLGSYYAPFASLHWLWWKQGKEAMTGQKGALHQNTFCLGSFLASLNPLPPHCCQHFPLQLLLSASLISSHPHLSPHSFLLNCNCPLLYAQSKQTARSCLIGPLPPPAPQQVGRSMAPHELWWWCVPVWAKRQIYP